MAHKQSHQYQSQSYKQNENQEEALIKFYIYQDLQNLINLIYSRNAVLEHFKDDPNNSMVTLSNNKIILQLNLSSGIHQDLQQQYSGTNLSNKLNEERQKAFKTLKEVTSSQGIQVGTPNSNKAQGKDQIEEYLKTFTQNYEYGKFSLNQFQLQQTSYVPQFNDKALSKLISSMQSIDDQTKQVSTNGNYQTPTPEQLKQRAIEYYNMTKEKLNQIDPNYSSAQFNNKQQNYSQGNKSLPANNIASIQPQPHQYFEETNINNKEASSIFLDKQGNRQSSLNSDQIHFNNKQECSSQDYGNFTNDNREIHGQIYSLNCEEQKYLITSDAKIEKEELIIFFKYLNYFSKSGGHYFDKEIKELVFQADQMVLKGSQLSYPEKQFAQELQQQKGAFQNLIQIHYYFELFFDYCQEMRPIKNLNSIRQFLAQNTNIGLINHSYFQFLISNKELIKSNLTSKSSIKNPQTTSGEEEFLYQMYKGYQDYYYKGRKI